MLNLLNLLSTMIDAVGGLAVIWVVVVLWLIGGPSSRSFE
jgi:hypothetical protein